MLVQNFKLWKIGTITNIMTNPDSAPQSFDLTSYNKEELKTFIEEGRDKFDYDQMEALLVLYEQDSPEAACEELGISVEEMMSLLEPIFGQIVSGGHDTPPQPEKHNSKGQARRRRLGSAALVQIIKERTELEPEEVQILEAAATSFNQVIAAHSLGITYKDFMARYQAIRRKYDF